MSVIPLWLLFFALFFGVVLGATIGAVAGAQPISVAWLYFVVVFGAISVIPCVPGKRGMYILATIYVPVPPHGNALLIFLLHTAVSVSVAAIATSIHKRWFRRCSENANGNAKV